MEKPKPEPSKNTSSSKIFDAPTYDLVPQPNVRTHQAYQQAYDRYKNYKVGKDGIIDAW